MATFAERMGHRASRTLVQNDDLDDETRSAIWNVLVALKETFAAVESESYRSDTTEERVLQTLWAGHFKKLRDEQRSNDQVWDLVKREVMGGEWYDALDVTEEIVRLLDRFESPFYLKDVASIFADLFNERFERFLVGYRFIGHEIAPVDSTAEAKAVSAAIEDVSGIAGARHSLNRAVELLADRTAPDYPNSIKESISAVEAITKKLTGRTTLGAGLKALESSGLPIHRALQEAWLKMYGWTSDEAGVRHGAIDPASVDQSLAKYVLVTCSAFVSYLIEEGRKLDLFRVDPQ